MGSVPAPKNLLATHISLNLHFTHEYWSFIFYRSDLHRSLLTDIIRSKENWLFDRKNELLHFVNYSMGRR